MVDLSKLPWGELKLPGELRASQRRDSAGEYVNVASKSMTPVAWTGADGWIVASGSPESVQNAIDSTKLVDAFVLEHSKPKLPDVVPPEGCEWQPDKRPYLFARGSGRCVCQPVDTGEREMFLACCEASDPGMTARINVSLTRGISGRYQWDLDMLRTLAPGDYAVSFRRLPDGK